MADRPKADGSLLGADESLTCDLIARGIFDRTKPALSVAVAEIERAGKRLVVITVPKGATFYANQKGTSTRRVGTTCRPFPPEEQRQAMASRGLYDWSALPTSAAIAELDPAELDRLRSILGRTGRGALARAQLGQLLSELHLVDDDGAVSRAGVLLLGRTETLRRHLPGHEFAYQFRRSTGMEASAHFRGALPILAAIDRILQAIEVRQNVRPLNVRGGIQLQLEDYPSSAVREIVVNAFVHRDYDASGAVDVLQTPEGLRVTSPGGLVFGVTADNILSHPSTPATSS